MSFLGWRDCCIFINSNAVSWLLWIVSWRVLMICEKVVNEEEGSQVDVDGWGRDLCWGIAAVWPERWISGLGWFASRFTLIVRGTLFLLALWIDAVLLTNRKLFHRWWSLRESHWFGGLAHKGEYKPVFSFIAITSHLLAANLLACWVSLLWQAGAIVLARNDCEFEGKESVVIEGRCRRSLFGS